MHVRAGFLCRSKHVFVTSQIFHRHFIFALSYVVMAVTKYMNRIIAASEATVKDANSRFRSSVQMALHDYTYGFTGDPLLQFACVYSGKGSDLNSSDLNQFFVLMLIPNFYFPCSY